ncbi:MAG: hypothetical protein HUU20_17495 [Pirellulales bacterium]|nr:hypothetical protein [Pirellulales bacterium]
MMKMKRVQSDHEVFGAADSEREYRLLIEGMARALAWGRTDDVVPHLARTFGAKHVELFVEGNLSKRLDLLTDMLSFVAEDEDFAEFEAWVHRFIEEVPVNAYENGAGECDAFLAWIEQTQRLSARQRDTIDCQRARYRVGRLADQRRAEHVRFRELCSLNGQFTAVLEDDLNLEIRLNPSRCWSELLSTKYLDEGDAPPVEVLHYAVGFDVRTVVLEENARRLIDELAGLQPCTLQQWIAISRTADRHSILALARDLAGLHLVAFA